MDNELHRTSAEKAARSLADSWTGMSPCSLFYIRATGTVRAGNGAIMPAPSRRLHHFREAAPVRSGVQRGRELKVPQCPATASPHRHRWCARFPRWSGRPCGCARGLPHSKWDERPLLVVVKKPGAEVSRDQVLAHMKGKVAKWWLPDDVTFVAEIPHTATGKISKLTWRERFKDYRFPAGM